MANKKRRSRSPAPQSQNSLNRGGDSGKAARVTHTVETRFEGPLPPPRLLAEYDTIVPGFAASLTSEFTEQSRHRRDLERRVVYGHTSAQTRGQIIAAGLFVATLIFGGWMATIGSDSVAIAAISFDFIGFGSVYVWGRTRQEAERSSRS